MNKHSSDTPFAIGNMKRKRSTAKNGKNLPLGESLLHSNYSLARSHAGGERAPAAYSLIGTVKPNGIDPRLTCSGASPTTPTTSSWTLITKATPGLSAIS